MKFADPLARAELEAAFAAVQEEQATRQGRQLTPMDRDVGFTVFHAATLAAKDVHEKITPRVFHVVSAPTGSGKSVNSVAYVAAAFWTDSEWSCAYLVDTVRLVDEFYNEIASLIGEENVVPYSWGHDEKRDESAVSLKQGFLPRRTATREEMKTARVLVTTHAQWRQEAQRGEHRGVTRWDRPDGTKARRDVVFVDEHPQLVKLIERTPHNVTALRDAIKQHSPDHPWVSTLTDTIGTMETLYATKGANYAAVELVPSDALTLLTNTAALHEAIGDTDHDSEHELTRRFLVAAGRGCCFLQRNRPASFIAYELEFQPGPGHVLLDATADLTGMTAIMQGAERLRVPLVDYSNLEIVHTPLPKKFTRRDVFDFAKTATEYADWIIRTMLEETEPGDRVLLVAPLKLYRQGRLPVAEDPANPKDIEGRLVSTLHWGVGIGTNNYRDCNVVFEAGEYHIPRSRVVADVLGWRGEIATQSRLDDANTPRARGRYLTAYEGHLLRWAKQSASRGSMRVIGADGRCGRMKLIKTMDRNRLLQNLDRMYPGAPPPVLRGATKGTKGRRRDPVGPLIELLAAPGEETITSDRIIETTKTAPKHISRLIKRAPVVAAMETYGWTWVTGRGQGQRSRLERRV